MYRFNLHLHAVFTAVVATALITSTAQAQKSKTVEVPALAATDGIRIRIDGSNAGFERAEALTAKTALKKAELAEAEAQRALLTTNAEIAKLESFGVRTIAGKPVVRAIVSTPDGTFRAWFHFPDGQTYWGIAGSKLPTGGTVVSISDDGATVQNGRVTESYQLIFNTRRLPEPNRTTASTNIGPGAPAGVRAVTGN